jgi:hypothetical protein
MPGGQQSGVQAAQRPAVLAWTSADVTAEYGIAVAAADQLTCKLDG